MTWFKVSDGFAFDPKAMRAGNAALGLWVRAGSWSGANLTDGWLSADIVGTLGGHVRAARRLVDSGLWIPDGAGYRFHDWSDWQPTRAQVKRDRAATRERVALWRAKQGNDVTNAVTNAVTDEVSNAVSNAAPSRPVLSSGLGSQSVQVRTAGGQVDRADIDRIARALGSDGTWANRVVRQVLDRAPAAVRDPTAYVLRAIRENPDDYRPTPTPPTWPELRAELWPEDQR